jgi:hypothetical protein
MSDEYQLSLASLSSFLQVVVPIENPFPNSDPAFPTALMVIYSSPRLHGAGIYKY